MLRLAAAVQSLQSQLGRFPGIIHKVIKDEGTVTVSAYSPGSQREDDVITFTALFVTPEIYPESQVWLMSDNEAVCDMLGAVADDFPYGATLELVITRVLSLLGHETDSLEHLMAEDPTVSMEVDVDDGYTDEELDFNYVSDGEFEEDRDLMITLGHSQGLWEKFEEKYERESQQEKEELSFKEKVAEGRQIFDTKAAYKILSNELVSIMKEESCNMVVDAIDNDVYRWSVELAGFDPNSSLFSDLMKLSDLHGYSTVQLVLTFKRGLHPFYPPRAEVIRPRFRGPVGWAVSSHPILRLAHWDPWRSQKLLLMEIKSFLQHYARVDLESTCNSLVEYPDAAYSPAEIQLARLEGLLEVRPRCANLPENKELYDNRNVEVDAARLAALSETKDINENEKRRSMYWAAGTGFGHGSGRGKSDVWDAKRAAAAQKAHDIETQKLLSELGQSLAVEIARKAQEDADEVEGRRHQTYALIPMLNDSCLIPFLLKELSNVSFTNMCERAEYYLSIVKVIHEICHPLSARMLYAASSDESSVFKCLTSLEEQAQCYTKVMVRQHKTGQPSTGRFRVGSSSGRSHADTEERLGIALADSIIACVTTLKELRISDPCEDQESTPPAPVTAQNQNREQEYIQKLKPHQIDFDGDISATHLFTKEATNESAMPKDRLVRLGREIAGLGSLLPLNSSSSVFVRIDEERQTLWTAMIVGPEDTPYSGGCFFFDIYFPPSYPNASPKVLLTTTGGGKVRFNPNLYKNGKVCLSLLGTWSGAAGETWDAAASSIYQVLVSIQSLILVSEPYFNEPGYEEMMHTSGGKNKSKQYNQDIREQTIHRAMIDYLRKPPSPFKSAIQSHFKLRKDYVMETCLKWIEEGEAAHTTSHVARLKTLVQELKTLLEDLP